MAPWARNTPPGFWGALALFLLVLAMIVLLLSDEVLLFLVFDRWGVVQVDFSLRFTAALTLMLVNVLLAIFAFGALRQKAQTGAEAMIGLPGVVMRVAETQTWVKVRGELWRAQSASVLQQGDEILVLGLQGLTLQVEKAKKGAEG